VVGATIAAVVTLVSSRRSKTAGAEHH